MAIPSALPLTGYQRAARSLGAKSAGSLVLGLGALALAPHAAEAGIVVFTPTSGNMQSAGDGYAAFFSLFGGQVSSDSYTPGFTPDGLFRVGESDPAGDHLITYVSGYTPNSAAFAANPGGGNDAYSFAAGAPIAATNWLRNVEFNRAGSGTGAVPAWSQATGYVGVRLPATGGEFYYGWMKFQTNANASTLTLLSFAINDVANAPILAGQTTAVPEPATSAALLALGAAGLVAYRRRKQLRRAA